MEFDRHGYYICPYNRECRCQIADCDYCGWNPDVSENRLEAFKQNLQEEEMVKRVVDINPIIKELAEQCLTTKGLECIVLGKVIDRLRAAPVLKERVEGSDTYTSADEMQTENH